MNTLAAILTAITENLGELDSSFALIGGWAVSVRCEARFTRDVDLAVAVTSDEQAESLLHGLGIRGYRITMLVEQEARGRLASARLIPVADDAQEMGTVIDLMFASSGIEPEIVSAAEPVELLPGLSVPTASLSHLLAMKLLSVEENRPQDEVDLRMLCAAATEPQLSETQRLLELIRQRGFHRQRDLQAQFRCYLDLYRRR